MEILKYLTLSWNKLSNVTSYQIYKYKDGELVQIGNAVGGHCSICGNSKEEGISMNQYCIYLLSMNDAYRTKEKVM